MGGLILKGIILAGGKGSRLFPTTISISKQLLPVYDKPLIYYPLSVLLLANIKDILLITSPDYVELYRKLLGDGSRLGIHIEYAVQNIPRGLADAFIIGEKFIGEDSVCLVLGDNVFYGQYFSEVLMEAKSLLENGGATIFGYPVKDPHSFGVLEFDENKKVKSLEEKPQNPKSNYAIPGLYFYDNNVIKIAKGINPSARGELEITDVNNVYLKNNKLHAVLMGRGMAWFDTGTPDSIYKAGAFVKTIQDMQGFYVSCIEEIAWRMGYISIDELETLGKELQCTDYGKYIISLAEENK